jgi:hypothetical protein
MTAQTPDALAEAIALLHRAGPAARWRPGDPDPLAEGLLVGFHTFAKAAALAAPPRCCAIGPNGSRGATAAPRTGRFTCPAARATGATCTATSC